MAPICHDLGMAEENRAVDFAVVAYLEEGIWRVATLPPRSARDLSPLIRALRQAPADAFALGMVSVDDDFFVLVRVEGKRTRCLISDATAATEWPLAREVIDFLELPVPDDDDQVQPGGDLSIVDDLGMDAREMGALCDDPDLYPDEMLTDIAARLGFGPAFRRVAGAAAGRPFTL
ncbi:MAG TPA: tRNA adenosine deaminase-associated protein [Actinopolymorphaceae bacterium]